MLETLNAFLWGPGTLVLILGTGAWLTLRTGGFPQRNLGQALALSLGFASGAMLYVVFGELMPEAILMWRSKLPAAATVIGMLTGVIIIYM